MKNCQGVVVALCFVGIFSPVVASAQAKPVPISLAADRATLTSQLQLVSMASGLDFSIDAALGQRRVTATITEVSPGEALLELAEAAGLRAVYNNGTWTFEEDSSLPQPREVTYVELWGHYVPPQPPMRDRLWVYRDYGYVASVPRPPAPSPVISAEWPRRPRSGLPPRPSTSALRRYFRLLDYAMEGGHVSNVEFFDAMQDTLDENDRNSEADLRWLGR